MYADDIVLLAENEHDLQNMLNALTHWCTLNSMTVNNAKSGIVHFRPQSVPMTDFDFMCGTEVIGKTDQYTYLGMALTEFLDYNVTAKRIAQSAGRALGLLIAKYKSIGGMPYHVFEKLFDTLVWPVISYGASIWGTKSYSCINAVQNRAMIFYLGTGKYTPTAAVFGDMGWHPPITKQWKCVCNIWSRFTSMDNLRINKRIFTWASNRANVSCKNWLYIAKEKFRSLGFFDYADVTRSFPKRIIGVNVTEAMLRIYINDWKTCVNRIAGTRDRGLNKLRTYRIFKSEFKTEDYCKMILPLSHRSAFAKFRCGVAPLRIETGRYENLDVRDRLCPFCVNNIENETHVQYL